MGNFIKVNKGEKFGFLTILGETGYKMSGERKIRLERCRCECGVEKFVRFDALYSGRTKSCGCKAREAQYYSGKMRKKHGMHGTRIYNIYCGIRKRCNNKASKSYSIYGGRGIKCKWGSFEEFYNDMYPSYIEHLKRYGEKDTTIDRIDVNGNYCKANCKWSTKKEQANNRRISTHLNSKKQNE